MPSAVRFVLKDSPPEVIEAAKNEPQGRSYNTERSQQPGGIKIEEVSMGLKLAALAITDDEEGTLKKISKTMPWHNQALQIITGAKEEARKPLSEILKSHMDLDLDHHIDVSGMSKAGHALDTQGFIAHNDEIIVLAYRCTTSVFDWLTNMTTTSSAWEHEDLAQGHSGYISCLADFNCCADPSSIKPRVHTGFYNNFLVTHPYIEQYIVPLLQPDQPPRKLYVVGHSLGAGIATMAACYFLLEHDWENLPHKLVTVTAGSPRACCKSMQIRVDEELKKLRPLDKAVFARVVRDKDCVPSVPPAMFGFRHVGKLVYITKDGAILINPSLDSGNFIPKNTMTDVLDMNPQVEDAIETQEPEEKDADEMTKYEKRVKMVPRSFRDHMPDFYLQPLIDLNEKEQRNKESEENTSSSASTVSSCPSDEAASFGADPAKENVKTPTSSTKKRYGPRRGFLRLFRKSKVRTSTQVPVASN